MVHRLLALIITLANMNTIWAQQNQTEFMLDVVVLDSLSGKPVDKAMCRVLSPEDKIKNYALADNNGRLSVSVCARDHLVFSALGYVKLTRSVSAFSTGTSNRIWLTEKSIALREVTIKAPPISAKGDTLVFNVKSFAAKGDSYLEDVLKKLPGIKVADNGMVSYQGKAINKFYIEGRDLLGNSYNQATRNMPVDAVRAVEVMENHQPVRMLQGRQTSEKAALNIRMDQSHKARPFGEVSGAMGYGHSTLWDGSVFLTQILGTSQLMLTGKTNNRGKDLSEETREHIDITDLDAFEPLPPSLLPGSGFQESLPMQRYVFNKSHSATLNHLVSLSKVATLRFNLLTYNDHSHYNSRHNYTYGGTTVVNLDEEKHLSRRSCTLLPILKYELNSTKAYVANELRYAYNSFCNVNSLTSNGDNIHETIRQRPVYVQNYLTSSFSWGDNVLQFKSLTRLLDRSEALQSLSDSLLVYNSDYAYTLKSWHTKNTLTTAFPLFGNYLELRAAFQYKDNEYDAGSLVHRRSMRYGLIPSYTITWNTNSSITMELPFEWLHAHITPFNHRRSLLFISPYLHLKCQLTHHWKVKLTLSSNKSDALASFYSLQPLRISHRTTFRPYSMPCFSSSNRISGGLSYQNLATMLFCNLTIAYNEEQRESYIDYEYTSQHTILTERNGKNRHRSFMINSDWGKSFTNAGLSLKSSLAYSLSTYLISQSNLQANNHANVLALDVAADYQKVKWMRLNIKLRGSLFWDRNAYAHSDALSSVASDVSVYLFPTKRWDIRMKYHHLLNEVTPSKYKNCHMLDGEIRFKINRKLEAHCTMDNLLNTKHYIVVQSTGFNTTRFDLPLRGRQALFGLLVHF